MSELLVRATVNLPGLNRGQEVLVDPDDPYMAGCLKTQLLVPVATYEPEPAPEEKPYDPWGLP